MWVSGKCETTTHTSQLQHFHGQVESTCLLPDQVNLRYIYQPSNFHEVSPVL